MEKAGKGSILHDGWSKMGVHYVGLFACYNKKQTLIHKKEIKENNVPEIALLSMSTLANKEIESEDGKTELDTNEVVNFNAENHCHHSREMFDFYDLNLETWVICQTADNAAVTKKIARILQIPHVCCKSHCLNHKVNKMVEYRKT
eukprot:2714716-Ditylum_brightwellii.AAC.1